MPRLRPRTYSASTARPRATSNTPAASATLGRFLATASSATPVTTKASAVLNDIGFLPPKVKMTEARTNQATITTRPTPTHSRPPSMTIASITHSATDGVPAGPSGTSAGGSLGAAEGGASPGASPTSSWPWISMALHPRASQVTARGPPRGGVSAARKALHPPTGSASVNHHELLTRLRQAQATPGSVSDTSSGAKHQAGLVESRIPQLVTEVLLIATDRQAASRFRPPDPQDGDSAAVASPRAVLRSRRTWVIASS